MLENGYYPYHLKRRIKSNKGHLSNKQALDLFTLYKPAGMSHVLLSHLSKDNNSPQLAKELFRQHAGETEVIVASRFEETPVFMITSSPDMATRKPLVFRKKQPKQKSSPAVQLSLF
jgi:ribonuclease BN (tRNA processing enzyme)